MLAQITPAVAATDWLSIGKMVGELFFGLLIAWTAYKAQKTATQVATIAPVVAAIAPVVQATAAKLETTANTVDIIHTLSNSAMSVQKKLTRDVTAAKAVLTKSPTDIAAADEAARDYNDHMVRQAAADAGVKS